MRNGKRFGATLRVSDRNYKVTSDNGIRTQIWERTMKMIEENRTLREFYPDPTIRHQVHYGFGHKFLPQYVHQNPFAFFSYLFRRDMPGGRMEPTRFVQSRWAMFEEMAGLVQQEKGSSNDGMAFRRVSDLEMTIADVCGRPAALVQMPAPERPNEAFFLCAVLLTDSDPTVWRPDVQARVFTLEASFERNEFGREIGILCEWASDGKHKNHAIETPAEREALLCAVEATVEVSEGSDAGGGVLPMGDVSSEEPKTRSERDDKPRMLEMCPFCGREVLFTRILCPACGKSVPEHLRGTESDELAEERRFLRLVEIGKSLIDQGLSAGDAIQAVGPESRVEELRRLLDSHSVDATLDRTSQRQGSRIFIPIIAGVYLLCFSSIGMEIAEEIGLLPVMIGSAILGTGVAIFLRWLTREMMPA